MKKIGILGGTFNPIHTGHLLLAQWAMDTAQLDEVWLIPTGNSYMKDPADIAPADDRYAMVNIAIRGNSRLKCLDMEIHRDGPTYTCDTLKELRSKYPENQFYFIFGADCLYSIEKWKNPREIFEHCTVIAALRDNASLEEMETKKEELVRTYGAKILLLPFLQIGISSTLIRERFRANKSIRYLVPDQVLEFLQEKGLYRYDKI